MQGRRCVDAGPENLNTTIGDVYDAVTTHRIPIPEALQDGFPLEMGQSFATQGEEPSDLLTFAAKTLQSAAKVFTYDYGTTAPLRVDGGLL